MTSPRIVCQSFQLYRVSFERVRIRRNSNNCASQVSKEMQDASRVREAKEQTPKARELAPSTRRIARQPSDGFAISGMHRQPTFASQQPTSDSDTSFDPGPLPATPTRQNRGTSVWRHACRQMLLRISAELRVHPAENVPFPNVSTEHRQHWKQCLQGSKMCQGMPSGVSRRQWQQTSIFGIHRCSAPASQESSARFRASSSIASDYTGLTHRLCRL